MARSYNGQIHIRVSAEVHEELAREAFERGVSISSLCTQALLMRRVLKHVDPWKIIAENWEANGNADLGHVENDIRAAVRQSRRARGAK